MAGLVISGTDTGVGKTYFSCLLLRTLRERGLDVVGYKPVCCGSREDAEDLLDACGRGESVEVVNPVWLKTPAAPLVAAELESAELRVADLVAGARALEERHGFVVTEGVGGWEVPLEEGKTFADFAVELGWPVVVVAANKLGALNHTLLTVNAVRARGLPLAGVVMNHLEEERDVAMVTNEAILKRWVESPVWAELMPGQDWLEEGLAESLVVGNG